MASVISNRWGCCGIEFCFRAEPEPNPEVLFTFDVRELYHVFGRQDPYQHQVENIPCFHVSRNVLLDPFLVRDQVDCVLSDVPCFVEPFIFEVMRDRLSTFCLQIVEHYHGHIPEGVRFHTVVVMHYRAGELRGRLVLMPSDPEPVEIIDADSEYYEDEGEIETERGFGGVSASEVAIANLERVSSAAARAQVESCSICFDEFEETQGDHSDLARLPCSHIFHYHCIAQWLERSRTCPLCRYEM